MVNKKTLEAATFNGKPFNGFQIDNKEALSKSGKLLQFNITPIAHYKSPYSDDLLQKFMHYLSRNAFNHDFQTYCEPVWTN
jgi:hypothetical protein